MADEKPEGDEAYQGRPEDERKSHSELTELLDRGLVAAVMNILHSLTEGELAKLPAKLLKRILKAIESLRSSGRGGEIANTEKRQRRQKEMDRLNALATVPEPEVSRNTQRDQTVEEKRTGPAQDGRLQSQIQNVAQTIAADAQEIATVKNKPVTDKPIGKPVDKSVITDQLQTQTQETDTAKSKTTPDKQPADRQQDQDKKADKGAERTDDPSKQKPGGKGPKPAKAKPAKTPAPDGNMEAVIIEEERKREEAKTKSASTVEPERVKAIGAELADFGAKHQIAVKAVDIADTATVAPKAVDAAPPLATGKDTGKGV